ncbi:hypothetical protein [Ensifer sp. SSB1]|uniref:hypothetical protein n=1 Tax=Ensifer sp. SSB1 TaxID=2795385 RepID=UPI001A5964E2|nr:hypothetical protein [Ensifer sp. SSB1]MBK5571303.1 hypothetical protein [Ensifer sp. SSB1]
MLAALEAAEGSRRDIARFASMSEQTVQKVVQRLKAEGKVRIADYERTVSDWRPIYGLGDAPDAKPPKPLTSRQINQNYRRKNLALLRAKARVATGFAAFYQQLARTS